MSDDRLTRALAYKRKRWAAERILEGFGWGRNVDHRGPAYMDAEYDWEQASEKHRQLIQSAWMDRLARRAADFTRLDAALARMKANPVVEAV